MSEADGDPEAAMERRAATHVAFMDESHQNLGRYRSVALISMRSEDADDIKARAAETIQRTGVSEFKWTRLAGDRYERAATTIAKDLIGLAKTGKLRADVLIWDTLDRRHAVAQRDDSKNLELMTYHLLRNACAKRWPGPRRWDIIPDESSVSWIDLHQILESGDGASRRGQQRLHGTFRPLPFEVNRIAPATSHSEPLIQYADLLAGLAVFSSSIFDEREWELNGLEAYDLHRAKQKQVRFHQQPLERKLSNSEVARIAFLRKFVKLADKAGWSFSIRRRAGLRSWHQSPINFWLYSPRNIKDRAPVKPPTEKLWYGFLRPSP